MLKMKLRGFKRYIELNRSVITTYAIIGGVGAVCGYLHYRGYKKGYADGAHKAAIFAQCAVNKYDEIHNANLDSALGKIMKDMIKPS